jgi:hypothetical protein
LRLTKNFNRQVSFEIIHKVLQVNAPENATAITKAPKTGLTESNKFANVSVTSYSPLCIPLREEHAASSLATAKGTPEYSAKRYSNGRVEVLINGKWLRTKQSQRWAGEFVWGNTSG